MHDEDKILEEKKLDEWDAERYPDEEKLRQLRCVRSYWFAALDVVNAWSAYNGKKKLYINAVHSETASKVKHVINDTFGGDAERVAERRDYLKVELDQKLAVFANVAKNCGMPSLTENWCFNNIPDGKVAAKLRGKIQRRLDKAKPIVPVGSLL